MSCNKLPVRLNFEVTVGDFTAFGQYFYKHTAEGRRGIRRMFFLGLVLAAVFIYSEYDRFARGGHDTLQTWVAPAIALALLLGAYGAYLWLLRPAVIRWACRGTALRETLGPTTLVLERNGISIENAHGKGRIAWAEILDAAETPSHIFLIIGHLRAFIIPKRAFNDDTAASACFRMVQECLNEARPG